MSAISRRGFCNRNCENGPRSAAPPRRFDGRRTGLALAHSGGRTTMSSPDAVLAAATTLAQWAHDRRRLWTDEPLARTNLGQNEVAEVPGVPEVLEIPGVFDVPAILEVATMQDVVELQATP